MKNFRKILMYTCLFLGFLLVGFTIYESTTNPYYEKKLQCGKILYKTIEYYNRNTIYVMVIDFNKRIKTIEVDLITYINNPQYSNGCFLFSDEYIQGEFKLLPFVLFGIMFIFLSFVIWLLEL
jgi:hypothetical protein